MIHTPRFEFGTPLQVKKEFGHLRSEVFKTFVPKKLQSDYDVCLKMVQKCGFGLIDVPLELRDERMCLEAAI